MNEKTTYNDNKTNQTKKNNDEEISNHNVGGFCRQWTQEDLKGKKVVINFWHTGCAPCIKEMPELGSWVRKHRDVLFLAVTYENAEKIKDIVKENKFHFHQLVDDKELRNQVGVSSYPYTLVLNEEGVITHIEVGTSPVQREKLLKALEK